MDTYMEEKKKALEYMAATKSRVELQTCGPLRIKNEVTWL